MEEANVSVSTDSLRQNWVMPVILLWDAEVKTIPSRDISAKVDLFSDPCLSHPCLGPNSFCQAHSANDFKCFCKDNQIAINGSAAEFGCKEIPFCGPHSNLHMDGSCRCQQDFFEEKIGDSESPKGCISKIKTQSIE